MRCTIFTLTVLTCAMFARAQTLAAESTAPAVSLSSDDLSAHAEDPQQIQQAGQAITWHSHRPDSHGPIGVMGDHMHRKGEWMLSYRYMHMDMNGSRDGTDRIGDRTVLQDFMVTPTEMTMDMHMFGFMFAPSDDLTLTAMLPYLRMDMEHLTRMGTTFSTQSEGIGDIKLAGLVKLYEQDHHHVHLNLGVSLPTGSIDETDATPMNPRAQLPYPMQLGSGTVDLMPGVTFTGQTDRWSWGGQFIATVRLGENDNDYTLGDRYNLTGWGAYQVTDWLSTSLRLNYETWGNIDGADPALNPMMVPTANPDLRGGSRLDLLLGINLMATGGPLKGHRIAIEGGLPIYQDLDGPQLETDWIITIGWQYAF